MAPTESALGKRMEDILTKYIYYVPDSAEFYSRLANILSCVKNATKEKFGNSKLIKALSNFEYYCNTKSKELPIKLIPKSELFAPRIKAAKESWPELEKQLISFTEKQKTLSVLKKELNHIFGTINSSLVSLYAQNDFENKLNDKEILFSKLYATFEATSKYWAEYDRFFYKWRANDISESEFLTELICVSKKFLTGIQKNEIPGSFAHNLYSFIEDADFQRGFRIPRNIFNIFHEMDFGINKKQAKYILIELKKLKDAKQ